MEVLILNNEFPPLGGGTASVNLELLECFAKEENLHIDLVTANNSRQFEIISFSERIRIFRLPTGNKDIHHASNFDLINYSLRSFFFSRKLLKQKNYDLCFAFSAVPAGAVAWALNKTNRLNYIVRVCGPDIPGFENRYSFIYPIISPLIKSVWRNAKNVIAKCKEEVEMINAVSPKIEVQIVENGVDMVRFDNKTNLPNNALKILCVARMIERKGQDQLIKAVKILKDRGREFKLIFVGEGDELENYKELSRALELDNKIIFSGYVPREKIPNYYGNAELFVLPSFSEGMSVATLEAMASGLPIVISKEGNTGSLVKENINGLTFPFGDVESLANSIEFFFENPEQLEKMGNNSREQAKEMSWQNATNKYLEMFKSITA